MKPAIVMEWEGKRWPAAEGVEACSAGREGLGFGAVRSWRVVQLVIE